MRDNHLLADLGVTGLDGNNGFAQVSGEVDGLLEGLWIWHGFNEEPKGGDAILLSEGADGIMEIKFELIAQ